MHIGGHINEFVAYMTTNRNLENQDVTNGANAHLGRSSGVLGQIRCSVPAVLVYILTPSDTPRTSYGQRTGHYRQRNRTLQTRNRTSYGHPTDILRTRNRTSPDTKEPPPSGTKVTPAQGALVSEFSLLFFATPIRRFADSPIPRFRRRFADSPIRRFADSLIR